MKYLMSFLKFDVSVGHKQLGDVNTMSSMHYEIVDTSNPAYENCQSICDIEARFERLRNYQMNADEVTFPQCKFKVLTVEILEESWRVKGWDQEDQLSA